MKVFLKRDSKKNWLLWWGINPQTIKYPINARKVQASVDAGPKPLNEKLKPYREKWNALYSGLVEIAEFEGSYSREQKTLTLRA